MHCLQCVSINASLQHLSTGGLLIICSTTSSVTRGVQLYSMQTSQPAETQIREVVPSLLLFIATFSAVGPYLVHDPVNLPVLSVDLLAHVQSHVAQVSYDPTHLLQVFVHLVLPGIICYPRYTEGERKGLKMGREQSMQIETCALAHTLQT